MENSGCTAGQKGYSIQHPPPTSCALPQTVPTQRSSEGVQ